MTEINTAEFMRAFDAWAEKAEQSYDNTLRSTALQLYSSIVLRTPVDTGRARGNWQISIDSTPSGEIGTAKSWADKGSEGVEAPNPSRTSDKVTNEAQAKVGQSLTPVKSYIAIVNNLPYIERLENGWSDQAPSGAVRVTLTEFEQKLRAAARDNQL